MSTYTEQELATIGNAPMQIGMAAAAVDLGIISTAKEAAALSKEVLNAGKKYPNNSIIQAAFSEEAMKAGSIKLDKEDITAEDVQSGTAVDKAIAATQEAIALTEGKATAEEVAEFKQFVYECAEVVANAAGTGLFGTGKEKVSDKEKVALEKIKTSLGF
ncbi:MAG: hypothetical protein IGR76_16545 [Synechococcales cyanobacterium T60_A2020_003]|nr:hypothetical protein [Synechococcales cyanobacterium T60_A2020_003]